MRKRTIAVLVIAIAIAIYIWRRRVNRTRLYRATVQNAATSSAFEFQDVGNRNRLQWSIQPESGSPSTDTFQIIEIIDTRTGLAAYTFDGITGAVSLAVLARGTTTVNPRDVLNKVRSAAVGAYIVRVRGGTLTQPLEGNIRWS